MPKEKRLEICSKWRTKSTHPITKTGGDIWKGELEPLTHGEKGKHAYRNSEVRMTKGEIRLRNVDFFLSICQKTMLLVLLHAARCEFECKSRM